MSERKPRPGPQRGLDSGTGEPWFEPKRYGYGAGLPVTRTGWIVTIGFMTAVILLGLSVVPLAELSLPLAILPVLIMLALTFWFVRLCARHTRGGWRWRWGEDEQRHD